MITIEKIFQDINKQMLEINYILNLGQLLKITLELKRYFWQKLKPQIFLNLSITTIGKQVSSSTPKVRIVVVVIDNHKTIIQV
jgi:hypothetical protein